MKSYYLICYFICLSFCTQAQTTNPLHQLLNVHPEYFEQIKAPKHQVQIIYTQINRSTEGVPQFKTFTYGTNTDNYYYPASTVKMPTAFLALEKINQLHIKGLDKYSTMKTSAATAPQTSVEADSSANDLRASIAHYIKKIFLVSDNDAYNRLYEFLGQAYLNKKLYAKGYTDSRIIHRLSVGGFDVEGNRLTNPVHFYNENNELLYHQGEVYSQSPHLFAIPQQIRGVGYWDDDKEKVIEEAFDFSYKNYVSLQDLHDMLQAVMFPTAVSPERRFDLTNDDYKFLKEWMSKTPKQSEEPRYDEPDNYVKFFWQDHDSTAVIPSHIKIYNKVGWAYGFLTDVSYVVDTKNNIDYFIAANIHVNENQIYNDGVYEYETIGLPFFANLGQVIYDYELKRKR